MKIKRKAYISLEVVFLLTIMVISGMYVTIKLFNKGHNVSGQEAEAFSKVNHTVNNAINVGSSGGGGSGGGGGGSTPSEPTGVIDTIYWGIDVSNKLIISDLPVVTATEGRSGSFAGTETFSSSSLPPWATHSNEIISIKVEKYNRRVAPTSTAYWFYDLQNVANADVSNLDTSYVADMKFTFYTVGYSASTVSISGLENWNTSNVTNMSYMFLSVGGNQASEIVISGMNNWDVSKVTNMRSMFDNVGYRLATTVDFGDISGWDTSSVTTMRDMFAYVGCLRNAAWTFGSLSNWDTSNVTDMYEMFYYNGGIGSTVLDMSNWDVSKVTNMSYMFYYCNIKTIITPASIQSGTTTSNITTKTFKGSDGKTYAAGTFPRGNTTSITLTAQ